MKPPREMSGRVTGLTPTKPETWPFTNATVQLPLACESHWPLGALKRYVTVPLGLMVVSRGVKEIGVPLITAVTVTSPLPIVALGTWAGMAVLAPFALAQSGAPARWTIDVVLAFAYLVVFGSCVGLVLQLWLTRRLRPTTMQLSQLIISAEALVVGGFALGEEITWRTLAGAGLVGCALVANALAGGAHAERVVAAMPGE